MYLIQIFLPLRDNHGKAIPHSLFERVSVELNNRFGGLTSYARSPATGLWKSRRSGRTMRDDIVIYEVIAPKLERRWWTKQRLRLQVAFRQKDILIRAQRISKL